MNFGQYINSLRKKEGYSIDGLAKKSGLSKAIITNILHRNYIPAAKHLISLSEVLIICPEALFTAARKMTPEMENLLYPDINRVGSLYYDAHVKNQTEDTFK